MKYTKTQNFAINLHHIKYGQLDLEFDSSAAKLVNLVILAQLVSSSVALPAQLVI